MKKILDWIKTNLLGIEKPRRSKKKKTSPSWKKKALSKKKTSVVKKTVKLKAPPPKPAVRVKPAKPLKVLKSKPPAKKIPVKAVSKPALKISAPLMKKTGVITHFFPNVQAAIVKMTAGAIEIGDEICFKGPATDFKITVKSMQMNRVPILVAEKGQEIGIQVPEKVREGDTVFKVIKK